MTTSPLRPLAAWCGNRHAITVSPHWARQRSQSRRLPPPLPD
ncbi:MAG TPA: hypothetical protein VMG10_09375 [Gemmataceae bacterium]|nr:hypothetical protein [Gemmataceae bacterium]